MKRSGQRIIDTFTDAERDDLLTLPIIDSVPMGLMLDAGLRKGEARALQVRRLKLDTREIVVVGGKGDKDRIVPMADRLAGLVEELLFLERLEPQAFLWYSRLVADGCSAGE